MVEQRAEGVVVTASLTNGVTRVTRGMNASVGLIDEVLSLEHADWETTLLVGSEEYYRTKSGPFPNHQMRISVRPSADCAALNYTDHENQAVPIMNSYSARRPLPEVDLIFNGETGSVFPRTAVIAVTDARMALLEWLQTRRRPTCIEWRPYDPY